MTIHHLHKPAVKEPQILSCMQLKNVDPLINLLRKPFYIYLIHLKSNTINITLNYIITLYIYYILTIYITKLTETQYF